MSGDDPLRGTVISTGRANQQRLDFAGLAPATRRPDPYAPGVALFWDDPHISQSMLKAHLDPAHDAASRRAATIEQTVAWLVEQLDLRAGADVLDLGCGPGLYAQRLAKRGMRVTGVDYSRSSIAYARDQAAASGLDIEYRYQDYRELADRSAFDVAMLIYYDLGALSAVDCDTVIDNIHRALRPGGRFVFDVLTLAGRRRARRKPGWQVSQAGFWRPEPHLVITDVYRYPQHRAELDQYVVVDSTGEYAVYRVWSTYYDVAAVQALLARHDFVVEGIWADLTGTALGGKEPHGLGVIARRLP